MNEKVVDVFSKVCKKVVGIFSKKDEVVEFVDIPFTPIKAVLHGKPTMIEDYESLQKVLKDEI